MRHAERIDTALRAALTAGSADLEAFFAEDVPEPFFVKNLERVQGDERDAIILSVGYGKHPDGRMRYQWGPLLRNGGERRLNVAATRAKHRLTVVSSFSSHDVDPGRLTKPGARLLAEYLEYANSGGIPVAASGAGSRISPFESDVASRLAELGITVVPQYGVGGYRVDFAAGHPDDPSRMILAVEADGTAYRDSGSVRDRDRLRKEHLERLGWRVHRLWSTSWFTDPDAELAKLRAAYTEAVRANPPAPEPPAAEPPEPAPSEAALPEPAPEPPAASAPLASAPQEHPPAAEPLLASPASPDQRPALAESSPPASALSSGSQLALPAPQDPTPP
jgi:very-short-patch-repair endonuclease